MRATASKTRRVSTSWCITPIERRSQNWRPQAADVSNLPEQTEHSVNANRSDGLCPRLACGQLRQQSLRLHRRFLHIDATAACIKNSQTLQIRQANTCLCLKGGTIFVVMRNIKGGPLMPEAVEVLITTTTAESRARRDQSPALPAFQSSRRRTQVATEPQCLAHEAAEETTDQEKTVPENSIESTRSVVSCHQSPW